LSTVAKLYSVKLRESKDGSEPEDESEAKDESEAEDKSEPKMTGEAAFKLAQETLRKATLDYNASLLENNNINNNWNEEMGWLF